RLRQRELVDELERLAVDARVHLLEELEALALVLELRVALPVGAHADALAQAVHRVEMVLPLRVEDLEQDAALAVLEARVALGGVVVGGGVAGLLLGGEIAADAVEQRASELLAVEALGRVEGRRARVEVHAELRRQRLGEVAQRLRLRLALLGPV